MSNPAEEGAAAVLAHLFRRDDTNHYCLCCDPGGLGIPAPFGGGVWRYVMAVELRPGEQRLAVDSDAAIAGLSQLGYHFVDGWYHQL